MDERQDDRHEAGQRSGGLDQGWGAKWGVGESWRTVCAHIGRRGGGPDSVGRRRGHGSDGDQCGHVSGFGRSGDEPKRHGVLAWVAAFDLHVIGRRARRPVVVTRINGMRVRGRPVIVVVIRVVVVGVHMHVPQHRRSRDRQHGRGDDGRYSAKHHGECMGKVRQGQTPGSWEETRRCAGVYSDA